MNYQEYIKIFEDMLKSENPPAPYDDPVYMDYTKLNLSRSKRWQKTMKVDARFIEAVANEQKKQHWIIITEPWCGDAAHILPFIIPVIENSDFITYEIQLRDSEPFLIDNYLTNGGKSIPKIIARDENGIDLFTYGPRPKQAQVVTDELKASGAEFEDIKIALQNWYNEDKGKSMYKELTALISSKVES